MKPLYCYIRTIMVVILNIGILLSLIVNIIAQIQKPMSDSVKVSQPGINLTLQLEGSIVKSGEPVTVALTVENNSPLAIVLGESSVVRDFKIEVKNENGKAVHLTKDGLRLTDPSAPVWRNRIVKLEPGKSRESKINLAYLYEMSNKGKYYISAVRGVRKTDGKSIRLQSNTVQVEVE